MGPWRHWCCCLLPPQPSRRSKDAFFLDVSSLCRLLRLCFSAVLVNSKHKLALKKTAKANPLKRTKATVSLLFKHWRLGVCWYSLLPFRQFAWQKQFLSSIQEMVSSSSPTLWRSLEEKKMNKNKYRLGPRGPRLHESISACPPAALLAPGDPKCVFQSSFDASLKSHTKWAPSMSWNDHWHRLYKS